MSLRSITLISLVISCAAGCVASSDAVDNPPAEGPAPSTFSPPADYVLTPNGYFHESCVVNLGDGEKLEGKATIRHRDGTTSPVPACDYPRYDKHGRVIQVSTTDAGSLSTSAVPKAGRTEPPPPTVNGYDVYAAAFNPAISSMYTTFQVPAPPSSWTGQTVYLFPGAEPNAAYEILQPVLAWNGLTANAWDLESWNCCVANTTVHSNPVPVNAGDYIYGALEGGGCSGNGVCGSWNVVSIDESNGQSTTLSTSDYSGAPINYLIGAALEAYNINGCDEYPSDSATWFASAGAYDVFGNYFNPSFGIIPIDSTCAESIYSVGNLLTVSTVPHAVGDPPVPSGCGVFYPGQGLRLGQSLSSCSGVYTLTMQGDGNLVLYHNGVGALWSTSTGVWNQYGYGAYMQYDGNFVLYRMDGLPLWASNTSGYNGSVAVVQDDGNFVVYSANGVPLWATGTNGR